MDGNEIGSTQLRALPRYMTVEQFVGEFTWATRGGLRQWIFHEHENGFHVCVRRVGRKLLLDVDKVFEWIEQQNN